jgi:acyl-CoA reductase-like NAD-dependent aldehyde dehydrogenase
VLFGAIMFSGQACMSTERLIVQRPASAPLLAELKKLASNVRAGAPSENVALSSLYTEAHAEGVLKLLKDAKAAGAEIAVGDLKRDGAVVMPHIVTGIKRDMHLWEQESFGPGAYRCAQV